MDNNDTQGSHIVDTNDGNEITHYCKILKYNDSKVKTPIKTEDKSRKCLLLLACKYPNFEIPIDSLNHIGTTLNFSKQWDSASFYATDMKSYQSHIQQFNLVLTKNPSKASRCLKNSTEKDLCC